MQIDVVNGGKTVSKVIGGPVSGLPDLLLAYPEVFLIYDEAVSSAIPELPSLKGSVAVDVSEEAKSMDTVLLLCRSMMEAGLSREAIVLAVGGGITTDMAGFAASIFKRGIRYATVPTTLLAMVDAAIGGKTGVNFDSYKNMLGAIRQPEFTYISSEFLRTLPERDFRSGAAELLKTFLIDNTSSNYEKAVEVLTNPSPETLQDLVFAAAAVKASIVGRDPYEKGERVKLNLGHTFAHAIEHEARLRGDDITHGEAVAMGIILSARLSNPALASRLEDDFRRAGLRTECPYPLDALRPAMFFDKKAEGGKVRFVLLRDIGDVVTEFLSPDEI